MPLYEFNCFTCGEFEAFCAIAQRDRPMLCPDCHQIAQRIFSPPNINLNSGSLSSIGSTSSSEPRLVKRKSEPAKIRYQSDRQGRPWMISHAPPRF
jgi:putative FmdB family regulatory protein